MTAKSGHKGVSHTPKRHNQISIWKAAATWQKAKIRGKKTIVTI